MPKIIIICYLLIFTIRISAQESKTKELLLSNKSNTIGIGSILVSDPYLSPLPYEGTILTISTNSLKLLSVVNKNVSTQNRLNIFSGKLLNPAQTSALLYTGANYQFGMYYHLHPIEKLLIMGGSAIDLDLGFKYMPRNVNNPFNLDLSGNVNLAAIAFYNIATRKRLLKLQLSVQSPLIGCMFVPELGASYYEIFDMGNTDNCFHLSSIHNKRGLKSEFLVHVPFKRTSWHVGFAANLLKYEANNMVYKRNEFSLLIGTSFDMIKFAGRKKKAPSEFLSPLE